MRGRRRGQPREPGAARVPARRRTVRTRRAALRRQDAFYENYFESQRESIFASVEVLIYVFDVASEDRDVRAGPRRWRRGVIVPSRNAVWSMRVCLVLVRVSVCCRLCA